MNRAAAASLATPPGKVTTVPPGAWKSTWKGRPSEPVKVGLRLLDAAMVSEMRRRAVEHAWRMYGRPESVDEREGAFMAFVMAQTVARATCEPDNENVPWARFFGAPDQNIELALTEQGIARLYEDAEAYAEVACPAHPKATAAELAELALALLPLEALVAFALKTAEDVPSSALQARLIAARMLAAPPVQMQSGAERVASTQGRLAARFLRRAVLLLEDLRALQGRTTRED